MTTSSLVKTELLTLVDEIHHACEVKWIKVEGNDGDSLSSMIGVNSWVSTQRILATAGFVKFNKQFNKLSFHEKDFTTACNEFCPDSSIQIECARFGRAANNKGHTMWMRIGMIGDEVPTVKQYVDRLKKNGGILTSRKHHASAMQSVYSDAIQTAIRKFNLSPVIIQTILDDQETASPSVITPTNDSENSSTSFSTTTTSQHSSTTSANIVSATKAIITPTSQSQLLLARAFVKVW
jgi:hypothetical protein